MQIIDKHEHSMNMRTLIANIDKVLTEYRSNHQRGVSERKVLYKFCKFHREAPVLESLFSTYFENICDMNDCF